MLNHPGMKIHLDFEEPSEPINGDPRRLAQVFDNLINNSLKYAPDADIYITLRKSTEFLVIEYRDSGPGVSEKNLPHLFTRFFRDPDQSLKIHGSGLGLSICKEIIEHHSGTIDVSCPKGWGLVFTIQLPINRAELNTSSGENHHER